MAYASGRETVLDRVLRVFTDVRPGEGTTAVLLMLNVFIILTAYYLMRPVREALILVGGGAELKSYLSAGQVVLLAVLVPLYGKLAGRLPRRALINGVTAFFIVCLLGFYGMAHAKIPVGVVFFLWIGIFNLMVIAQFWSFANDVYSEEEGKRLFPVVAFGASSGAVVGSLIAGKLIAPLGVYQLLLLAGVLLGLSLVFTNIVDARERRRTEAHLSPTTSSATLPAIKIIPGVGPQEPEPDVAPEEPVGNTGAFQLVFRHRYLLLIALLLLLLNWVNTTGEYILGKTVQRVAAASVADGTSGGLSEGQIIGKFYSNFQFGVNLTGLLLQLFVVSRILKYLGVRVAIMFLPVIALVGYSVLALIPVLGAISWAKTAENATDYSLNNTVRNVLFLPTTREQKYKAKQAIDSFFVRAGDVLAALVIFVGTTYLALQPQHFAGISILLVLVWLTIAVMIGREYVVKTRA